MIFKVPNHGVWTFSKYLFQYKIEIATCDARRVIKSIMMTQSIARKCCKILGLWESWDATGI